MRDFWKPMSVNGKLISVLSYLPAAFVNSLIDNFLYSSFFMYFSPITPTLKINILIEIWLLFHFQISGQNLC